MKNAQLQKMLAKLPPDADVLINIFDGGVIRTKKGLRVGGRKGWRGNNFSDLTCVKLVKDGMRDSVRVKFEKPTVVIGRSTAFSL